MGRILDYHLWILTLGLVAVGAIPQERYRTSLTPDGAVQDMFMNVQGHVLDSAVSEAGAVALLVNGAHRNHAKGQDHKDDSQNAAHYRASRRNWFVGCNGEFQRFTVRNAIIREQNHQQQRNNAAADG